LALGLWLPFVLATTGCAVLTRAVWGQWPAGLPVVALTLLIIAAVPLVEGWHRRWPMTYVLPIFAVVVSVVAPRALWTLTPSWPHTPLWRVLALAWLGWAAAVRTRRSPDRPPLSGSLAALAGPSLAIAFMWTGARGPATVGTLESLAERCWFWLLS